MTDTSSNPAADDAPATAESSQQSAPDSDGSAVTRSPFLWLVAGLIAAVILPRVAEYALSQEVPISEEFQSLSTLEQLNDEQAAQMNEMMKTKTIGNLRQLWIGCGAVVAICFGLFSGIIHRHLVMGLVGAIVGVCIAFGIASVATQPILDLQKDAIRGNDTSAILLHSAQWIAFGLCAAVAVGLGSLRGVTFAKALVATTIAGVLGGLLYVIGGTLLDPANQTGKAAPLPGMTRYLWASLPPLLAGLFLIRAK